MAGNVMSFGVAVSKGFDLGLYSFDPAKIPLGVYDAVLHFKIWSKRIMAFNCYFTKMQTGEKFVLTVYCNYKNGRYNVGESLINFADCAIGIAYRISVKKITKEASI
jgi:hypothetical protein